MINRIMAVRPELCTGCRACEMACAAERSDVANPRFARVRIVKIETRGFDYPSICRQCAKPPCADSCPVGALIACSGGGVRVISGSCIGCGQCLDSCPYGGLKIEPGQDVPVVCDTCDGRAPCVDRCPTQALRCLSLSELASVAAARSADNAALKIIPTLHPDISPPPSLAEPTENA